jgi:hypothetical protein
MSQKSNNNINNNENNKELFVIITALPTQVPNNDVPNSNIISGANHGTSLTWR